MLRHAVLALCCALVVLASPVVEARDLSGRFGLGADGSLGWKHLSPSLSSEAQSLDGTEVGNTGLSLVYYFTPMFGLQLIVGSTLTTVTAEAEVQGFAHRTGVALRALVPFALTDEVNLAGVFGLSGVFASFDNYGADMGAAEGMYLSLDVGLRPEWFVTDHFSLHTQLGLVISLLTEDNLGVPPAGRGVTIDVFGSADLLGQAGFTFWF